MTALDNIVTLGLTDDDKAASLSGYTLLAAAGMSPINLDKIATEQYVQGITLAQKKKQLAINSVKNDFLAYLQANNIASILSNPSYNTSDFNAAVSMGNYAGLRGVNLHRIVNYRSTLSKTKITAIQCYPFTDGAGEIVIQDTINGIVKDIPYDVTFVANKVNTFAIDYVIQGQNASVVIDNSVISFASAIITCKTGCNNAPPNPCGWADGWNGVQNVKAEGFGINVVFQCYCDYDQVLCDLSRTFTGELIWLKWQEYIFDEQRKTNRFNSWVIYNHEELPDLISELQTQYNSRFNDLSAGVYNMLKSYRDDTCLMCRGIRTIVNI